jgi:hypothetical protein
MAVKYSRFGVEISQIRVKPRMGRNIIAMGIAHRLKDNLPQALKGREMNILGFTLC